MEGCSLRMVQADASHSKSSDHETKGQQGLYHVLLSLGFDHFCNHDKTAIDFSSLLHVSFGLSWYLCSAE